VLEGVRGLLAAGAGGRGGIVPAWVGAEVALARPHLVYAPHVELAKAHKRMGLKCGAEDVPGGVRRGLLPFFHEEVPAQELELGVGAARGGRGVVFTEQVL